MLCGNGMSRKHLDLPEHISVMRWIGSGREDELVVQTSLYAHLLDQTEWGMLKPDKAWSAGKQLLRQLGWEEKKQPQMSEPKSTDVKDTWIMWMTEYYMQMVLNRITLSSGKN